MIPQNQVASKSTSTSTFAPSHWVFLDALRSIAAFGVAIAHFFAQRGSNIGEFWSAFFVELFFPLSGFVLAPQIIRVMKFPSDLSIFYVRRWLRTLPPYWIALCISAILAGSLISKDTVFYFFFIQCFGEPFQVSDFFPIAWSLSVEEWYYLVFPLWILLAKKLRFNQVFGAILFCIFFQIIKILSVFCVSVDNYRTLTWLRLDAIGYGFLIWNWRHVKISKFIFLLLCLIFCLSAGYLVFTANAKSLNWFQKWGFIQTAMFSSNFILWCAIRFEPSKIPSFLSKIFLIGGKVSYPLYLFHLFLSRFFGDGTLSFTLYVITIFFAAASFHLVVEAPILLRRPSYPERSFKNDFSFF